MVESGHSSDTQIRLATSDDLPEIVACATVAYARYVDLIGKEPAPMIADFSSQVEQGIVSVALNNGGFSGFVVFYPTDKNCVHLENVAVLPECAGKGMGKLLVQYVENWATQRGYLRVELYTNEAMAENLAIYPKLGYHEVGRKTQAGFNRVFFRKRLQH